MFFGDFFWHLYRNAPYGHGGGFARASPKH
jgi:hypothetical protein